MTLFNDLQALAISDHEEYRKLIILLKKAGAVSGDTDIIFVDEEALEREHQILKKRIHERQLLLPFITLREKNPDNPIIQCIREIWRPFPYIGLHLWFCSPEQKRWFLENCTIQLGIEMTDGSLKVCPEYLAMNSLKTPQESINAKLMVHFTTPKDEIFFTSTQVTFKSKEGHSFTFKFFDPLNEGIDIRKK